MSYSVSELFCHFNIKSYSAWQRYLCFARSLRILGPSPEDRRATPCRPLYYRNHEHLPTALISRRTNDERDLQFFDPIADSYQLAQTPNESIPLNRSHTVFQCFHVCLIIPRLDVESNHRLHTNTSSTKESEDFDIYKKQNRVLVYKDCANLGSSLGFASLLEIVCSNTFCLQLFCFRVLFIILTKEVNFVIFLSSRDRGGGGGGECFPCFARSRKGTVLCCV